MTYDGFEQADGIRDAFTNGSGGQAAQQQSVIREVDDEYIEPRGWLLGTAFCRKFVSLLLGDGGVGKTALRYLQYLSLATARPLTGEHVHHRGRVLIVSLEDDADEVRRRLRAAMLQYGISAADTRGYLHYWTPNRIKLMDAVEGVLVPGKLEIELRVAIHTHKIDLISIDPFVKSHSADENNNNQVDQVCVLLTTIASECNCAVDLLHHTRKGPSDPGNADTGRGASAMKDGARLVRTMNRMSTDEAQLFGLDEHERSHLVRIDNGKVNITPPAAGATWFRLVGVELGNGNDLYPHGDEVQTVEPWDPPDNFAGVSSATWNVIIDEIDAGLPSGSRYTDANNATDRAAWRVIVKHLDRTERQARQIVGTWVKNSVLLKEQYDDPWHVSRSSG
jgi:AAA domain